MQELSPELVLVDDDLAREARAALPPAPDVLAAVARHHESEPVRRLRAALAADELSEARRARRPALRLVAGGLAALGVIAGAALALRPDTSNTAARRPAASARPAVVRPAAVRAARPAPTRAVPPKQARVPAAPHLVPALTSHATAAVRRAPSVRPAAVRPHPASAPVRHRHAVPAKPAAPTVGHAVMKPATAHVAEPLPVLSWAADNQATHYRVGLFHEGDPPTLVCEVWTDDAHLALSSVSTPASRPLVPGDYRWVVYPVFGGDGSLGSGRTTDTQLAQGTFTL